MYYYVTVVILLVSPLITKLCHVLCRRGYIACIASLIPNHQVVITKWTLDIVKSELLIIRALSSASI